MMVTLLVPCADVSRSSVGSPFALSGVPKFSLAFTWQTSGLESMVFQQHVDLPSRSSDAGRFEF
jgi:hypothetical protein